MALSKSGSPLPSRNPLPLAPAQEAEISELYYKRVRDFCSSQIRGDFTIYHTYFACQLILDNSDFAHCAAGRTVSSAWACRTQRLAMKSCMAGRATLEEQDAAREEWFATIDDRRREKEEYERKKEEQAKFHRAWWGLPEPHDQNKRQEENKSI